MKTSNYSINICNNINVYNNINLTKGSKIIKRNHSTKLFKKGKFNIIVNNRYGTVIHNNLNSLHIQIDLYTILISNLTLIFKSVQNCFYHIVSFNFDNIKDANLTDSKLYTNLIIRSLLFLFLLKFYYIMVAIKITIAPIAVLVFILIIWILSSIKLKKAYADILSAKLFSNILCFVLFMSTIYLAFCAYKYKFNINTNEINFNSFYLSYNVLIFEILYMLVKFIPFDLCYDFVITNTSNSSCEDIGTNKEFNQNKSGNKGSSGQSSGGEGSSGQGPNNPKDYKYSYLPFALLNLADPRSIYDEDWTGRQITITSNNGDIYNVEDITEQEYQDLNSKYGLERNEIKRLIVLKAMSHRRKSLDVLAKNLLEHETLYNMLSYPTKDGNFYFSIFPRIDDREISTVIDPTNPLSKIPILCTLFINKNLPELQVGNYTFVQPSYRVLYRDIEPGLTEQDKIAIVRHFEEHNRVFRTRAILGAWQFEGHGTNRRLSGNSMLTNVRFGWRGMNHFLSIQPTNN